MLSSGGKMKIIPINSLSINNGSFQRRDGVMFYVPLNIKQVILDTFFPANLLA